MSIVGADVLRITVSIHDDFALDGKKVIEFSFAIENEDPIPDAVVLQGIDSGVTVIIEDDEGEPVVGC